MTLNPNPLKVLSEENDGVYSVFKLVVVFHSQLRCEFKE